MRFDSYHPAINLIYFVSVICAALCFLHPVFLIISYLCAFAYSVKLIGRRALIFNFCLIPCILIWTLWYAVYHHFGVTPIRNNLIGNSITLESLAYGGALGIAYASAIMWVECVHDVFCTDKICYLFGRVSPKISLMLAIVLRAMPRIRAQSIKICTAQRCIGRGAGQGTIWARCRNALRRASMLLMWSIESFVATSDSMRSRGYTLSGRTAYSLYRFDNRDRSFVIVIFVCLTLLAMAVLFSQTRIHYNPHIILNRITPLSGVFYAAYALLCLLPMGLQIAGEIRFKHQQSAGER